MKNLDQYHSVEIAVADSVPYHFRIWHIDPDSNIILIKENSNILPHLRVGARFNMRYYSPGEVYPEGFRETAIKEISRDEQGRFRGHFLVGLELLEE